MKKVLTIFLAMLFATTILTSCGGIGGNSGKIDKRLIGKYKQLSFAGNKVEGYIEINENGEFTYKSLKKPNGSCNGRFKFGNIEYGKPPYNEQFSQTILNCKLENTPDESSIFSLVKWGIGSSIGFEQRDATGPNPINSMYLWIDYPVEQGVLFVEF